MCLVTNQDDMVSAIARAHHYLSEILDEELDTYETEESVPHYITDELDQYTGYSGPVDPDHHFYMANKRAGLPVNTPHITPDGVELCFTTETWKLAWQGLDMSKVEVPKSNEFLITKARNRNTNKTKVVERADHILSKDEMNQNWDEVAAAMITELKTWADLNCFERRPRKICLLYTSPSPRDRTRSRMPSSA